MNVELSIIFLVLRSLIVQHEVPWDIFESMDLGGNDLPCMSEFSVVKQF